MGDNSFVSTTYLAILIIILFFLLLGIAIIDDANPGEICTERNFGAEVWMPDENGIQTIGTNYYCARISNGTPEVRPVEWVEENCGNNGVCVDD